MTFKRFKQLWIESGLPLPTETDMSEHTVDALVAASDGDFSHFDRIQHILDERDRRGTA